MKCNQLYTEISSPERQQTLSRKLIIASESKVSKDDSTTHSKKLFPPSEGGEKFILLNPRLAGQQNVMKLLQAPIIHTALEWSAKQSSYHE